MNYFLTLLLFYFTCLDYAYSRNLHNINDFSTVCHFGCDYRDLQNAIYATRPGGTVYIKSETIHTCGLINKPLKIIGELIGGQPPSLKSTSCRGKGALIIEANDVQISNLEISDINVWDDNGACIRVGPAAKHVVLKNIYCHDSQNGILAGFYNAGKLSVVDSIFERCGAGGAVTWSLYPNRWRCFL